MSRYLPIRVYDYYAPGEFVQLAMVDRKLMNQHFHFRTFQRNNLRLLADLFAEHLRSLWQLSMSLLLNLQCSPQIIHLARTTPGNRQHSHLPTLPDSEQQLDPTLERMALKLICCCFMSDEDENCSFSFSWSIGESSSRASGSEGSPDLWFILFAVHFDSGLQSRLGF